MQKLERIFVQLHRPNNIFKLAPSSFKLFTTDKPSSADTADTALKHLAEELNKNLIEKAVEEKHDDSLNQVQEFTKPSGFVKSSEKYTALSEPKIDDEQASFATLLRNSNLMHLGDPEGKKTVGKIFHIVNNDLYIDFGWKFYCVCPKPVKNNSDYVRGAIVRLRIKDLELSTRFLGGTKDITILEADCVLLGLISSPNKINKDIDDANRSIAAAAEEQAITTTA